MAADFARELEEMYPLTPKAAKDIILHTISDITLSYERSPELVQRVQEEIKDSTRSIIRNHNGRSGTISFKYLQAHFFNYSRAYDDFFDPFESTVKSALEGIAQELARKSTSFNNLRALQYDQYDQYGNRPETEESTPDPSNNDFFPDLPERDEDMVQELEFGL